VGLNVNATVPLDGRAARATPDLMTAMDATSPDDA
jgi:hypothetical protein